MDMWGYGGEVLNEISEKFELHEAQVKQCMKWCEETGDIVDGDEGAQEWQVPDSV